MDVRVGNKGIPLKLHHSFHTKQLCEIVFALLLSLIEKLVRKVLKQKPSRVNRQLIKHFCNIMLCRKTTHSLQFILENLRSSQRNHSRMKMMCTRRREIDNARHRSRCCQSFLRDYLMITIKIFGEMSIKNIWTTCCK